MKYLFQFCRIMIVCFLGEIMSSLIPYPIPASVYGLVLMLIFLKTGIYQLEQVSETGYFFVGILTILFVPSAVGVMEQWDAIKNVIVPCLIAVFLVTALVMGVSGKLTQFFHRFTEKDK